MEGDEHGGVGATGRREGGGREEREERRQQRRRGRRAGCGEAGKRIAAKRCCPTPPAPGLRAVDGRALEVEDVVRLHTGFTSATLVACAAVSSRSSLMTGASRRRGSD